MPDVVVIPGDKTIAVNGLTLFMESEDFPEHDENIRAIHWYGDPDTGSGSLELEDDYGMELGPILYNEEVKPYVDAFNNHFHKIQQAQEAAYTEYRKHYNSREERFARLRLLRNQKLADYDQKISQLEREQRLCNDNEKANRITDLIKQWDAYANELCALPDNPEAPWDGGDNPEGPQAVPWPVPPAMPTKNSL